MTPLYGEIMTPDDDDLPPQPAPVDIPILVWVIGGALLALAFCVAVFMLRPDR
jgi:hypothetical protein